MSNRNESFEKGGARKRAPNRATRTRHITYGAVIAASYVLLTLISDLIPANPFGAIRLSEALCVTVIFTPAAIPGLTLGCLLSNVICGGAPADVICGTAVTLVSALCGYVLRRRPYLVPIPTVLFNAFAVPPILSVCYGIAAGYWVLFPIVLGGEILCAGFAGIALYRVLASSPALRKRHF